MIGNGNDGGNAQMGTEDDELGFTEDKVPDTGGAALHTDAPVGLGLDQGETAEVYPAEGKVSETAHALNEAAEPLGHLSRVQWSGGTFTVPKEVADAADLPGGGQTVDPAGAGGVPDADPDGPAKNPNPAETASADDRPVGGDVAEPGSAAPKLSAPRRSGKQQQTDAPN